MGTWHSAKLVYGINLGDFDGYHIHEAKDEDGDPWGELKLPWMEEITAKYPDLTEHLDEDDEPNPQDLFMARLFDSITDRPDCEYDWQREDVVKERLGVWFEHHGDLENATNWILATSDREVSAGEVSLLDLGELAALPAADGWDQRVANAVKVLGITPVQERPGWLLCADRG